MIHLDYRDVRPIYTQIIDGFREQIATGCLQPGEKLPSVRELASQLAINPNTIQRSYRQLEMEGWIVTIPGKGSFVCENEESRRRETRRWMDAFVEAAAALTALGVGKEELMERLKELE